MLIPPDNRPSSSSVVASSSKMMSEEEDPSVDVARTSENSANGTAREQHDSRLEEHEQDQERQQAQQGQNGEHLEENEQREKSESCQDEGGNAPSPPKDTVNVDAAPPVTRGFVQRPPAPIQQQKQDQQPHLPMMYTSSAPAELQSIPVGDHRVRSKLKFEVTTARVNEKAGKKFVSYSITIKRLPGNDPHPAVIDRRYSDFVFIYENVLRNFHPSVLGDFMFPKKVLIGNFKAEVITDRTESFHRFLGLIADSDKLLYSEYFYSFLTSEEHNEAVSHIKLGRYAEAVPLLKSLFSVQEKLLTISNVHVLQCLCELVAALHAIREYEVALSYALVAAKSLELCRGHPDAEALRVPFLKLASALAAELGHDRKPYDKQLSELRYQGIRVEAARTLLDVIRDRYIHQASRTAKLA